MGKREKEQVKIVEQLPFKVMEEVSFEDFDHTMKKIVQAKPPQKKPPKEGQKRADNHN